MGMKAILCADKNWGIGYRGKVLVSIPADLRFFREKTEGHVVVMGRKTFESISYKPLPDRVNIVLTSSRSLAVPGAVFVHSEEELLRELRKYETDDIFVIGGSVVYNMLLPYCDTAYVTKVDYAYQADTWFPDLDVRPEWTLIRQSEEQTYFDLEYRFCTYRRTGSEEAAEQISA